MKRIWTKDGWPPDVTIEEYSGLRADMPLDPKLYDPQFFPTVH